MPEINLTNKKGRDATVFMQGVKLPTPVRWLDSEGKQASSIRVMKSTLSQSLKKIQGDDELEDVAQKLIDGDPEVDLETVGTMVQGTRRIFLGSDNQILHAVRHEEVLYNPDGSERERRPLQVKEPNICTETPLKWSGKLFKKAQVINRFVFQRKMQIVHVNGLTYDFLFGMAKELEAKDSMMLLGGGSKGAEPLVLRRGAVPARGFLEGRTDGEKYCLILHLSAMELKAPEVTKMEKRAEAQKEKGKEKTPAAASKKKSKKKA